MGPFGIYIYAEMAVLLYMDVLLFFSHCLFALDLVVIDLEGEYGNKGKWIASPVWLITEVKSEW